MNKMNDPKDKRVLIITEVFAPEDFLINDLVFSWKYEGYSVSVLTRNPSYPQGKIYPGYKNPLYKNEFINGVPVFRVQFIPGYKTNRHVKILNYLWNMLLGMLWAIKNGNKFDSVFIYQTGPLTFSSIGVLIKKLYKKTTTIWTQDVWPDTVYAYGVAQNGLSRIILEWFVKWIYSNCDNITVSSPGFEAIISKYCSTKKIQYIPQWSATKKLTDCKETYVDINYPGKFNFVFAGNIGEVQNLENVILGFGTFQKHTCKKDIWLNLIGDGSYLNFLKQKVNEKNIENVKFWGRKKSIDIPYYYEKADVLIISLDNKPIFNVTIPAKFQSYLNSEKPIFGVIQGEVASLIRNNNLGWVVSPDNIEEIAKAFLEISNCQPETFNEKAFNANILLDTEFNREKIIHDFTKIIFDNS